MKFQGQGYSNGSGNQQFMNRIEKAMTKCMVYMEKSLTCDPPKSKISKYAHRLSAVFLDSVHHLNVGKCEPKSAGGKFKLILNLRSKNTLKENLN